MTDGTSKGKLIYWFLTVIHYLPISAVYSKKNLTKGHLCIIEIFLYLLFLVVSHWIIGALC